MTMMKAIFDGKVYPAEQVVSNDPEYKEALNNYDRLMRKLEQELDKSEYDVVEEMLDVQSVLTECQNREFFRCGLSMGIALREEAEEMLKRLYDAESNHGNNSEASPD